MAEKKLTNPSEDAEKSPAQTFAEALSLEWDGAIILGFTKEHGLTILASRISDERSLFLLKLAESDLIMSFWEDRADEHEEMDNDD